MVVGVRRDGKGEEDGFEKLMWGIIVRRVRRKKGFGGCVLGERSFCGNKVVRRFLVLCWYGRNVFGGKGGWRMGEYGGGKVERMG